jgi:hypothetical protein
VRAALLLIVGRSLQKLGGRPLNSASTACNHDSLSFYEGRISENVSLTEGHICKSQGHGIAKDAVYALLGHLMDAFLLSAVPLATESERQRNSNPRKVYPLDPALIGAFVVGGRQNLGHALETVVLNELERRKADVGYVKTAEGFEVDFCIRYLEGNEELVQVCADPSAPRTWERELRALIQAGRDYPHAVRRLLVLTRDQAAASPEAGITIQPAYEWLLAAPG